MASGYSEGESRKHTSTDRRGVRRVANTSSVSARLAGLIRRSPLTSFFLLAFGVAWILWLPLVIAGDSSPSGLGVVLLLLGSLVPSATAVALVAVLYGRAGLRELWVRLRLWRVGFAWWLAVLVAPAIAIAAVGLSVALGGASPEVTVTIPGAAFLFLFSIFPGSAGGEEIGWRGFALPRLQASRSALRASLILGAAWGVWHLPLYLVGSEIRPLTLFLPWVVLAAAVSVIYTWIYNGTGGSLLLVVVLHAASNVPLTIFFEPLEDQVVQPFLIYCGLMVVAAGLVAAIAGPSTLARRHPKQVAAP